MKFTSAWANRCGKPLNTSICAGVINPARGRGAALTYANCVAGALADRRLADAGEFACILEDDARPFSTDWCDASEREAIVRQMPSEALLLLIGGHDMEAQPGYSRAPVTCSTSRPYKFRRLSKFYGSYAFCYRGTDAPLVHNILRDIFHFGCTDPPCRKVDTKAAVSPEKMLLWHAERLGRTIWTIEPFLIAHDPKSYSNTWAPTPMGGVEIISARKQWAKCRHVECRTPEQARTYNWNLTDSVLARQNIMFQSDIVHSPTDDTVSDEASCTCNASLSRPHWDSPT